MQAGWKEGVVAQPIALGDAFLEVQGFLSEELHWKNTSICPITVLHLWLKQHSNCELPDSIGRP